MFRRALAALALVAGCSLSANARADEPVRVPVYDPGAYPPPSARYGLLAAGAGTTLAWYGGSVAFSYLWPEAPGARDLRIPVAGPWLALGHTGCADDNPGCGSLMVVARAILTTLDGVAQAGGLAIAGEALFLPTAAPAAPGFRARASHSRRRALSVRPTPFFAGKDGLGVGVAGQF